jgi:hypothetical protein
MVIPNGEGALLRTEHAGKTARENLIVLLTAKIVEPAASTSQNIKPGVNLTYEPGRPLPSPVPNEHPQTNVIYTSAARQKIFKKLNEIWFDKAFYPGLTLDEVVRDLQMETRQHDPDREGINFVLNRMTPPATFDPATGQPIVANPPTPMEDVALGKVVISLDPGLRKVRLIDVLEAIVKSSDHPIKYSLLDYGIEFSFKGPDVPELYTRTFKVDPNAIYTGLQNVRTLKPATTQTAGGGGTNAVRNLRYGSFDPTTDIQLAVINFFNSAGVNLSAPKSVFFNDRQGSLTVHATADDLDLIEQAISTLNTPNGNIVQPEAKVIPASAAGELHTRTFKVNMHTFFIGGYQSGVFTNQINRSKSSAEMQSTLANAFRKAGVDLSAPKSLFFSDSKGTLTFNATEADLNLLESLISKWNTPRPQLTIKVRFVEVDADNKGLNALLGGILTNAPGTSNNSPILCGILTEPMFKSVLKALEKRDHADLLNEGEVTTLSGRRANIQVVDITPILTGLPRTNSSTPEVGTVFTTNGTIFDVAPYVGADGYTVQMTATPTATEFLGYANSETSSKIDKAFKSAHQSFPAFRIRTATLSATVWDQQTLVLGNLNDELVVNELNEEFRRPFIDTKKKQLFVFITPTIIDAVGNRIHSKDYYDGPTY